MMRWPTLVAVAVASAGAGAQAPRADLILWNARVLTVDSAFTIAEAVAVRDGRIVAVGRNREVRALSGPRTRELDLQGRTVVPGLADGHLHDAGGGPDIDLSSTRSLHELLAIIGAAARRAAPGDVLFTNNDWHEAQLREQHLPYRADLDRVSAGVPVVVVRGGHEMILNSAALARWGITEQTASPAGGQISRDASGRLTGELIDRAMGLVKRPAPPPPTEASMAAKFARLNAAGLTSVRMPGGTVAQYQLLKRMRDAGTLTVRVNFLFRLGDASSPERVRAQVTSWGVAPDAGDGWLRVGGVKLVSDGGFEGGFMREPYAGEFGRDGTYRGLQLMSDSAFRTATRTLNALGWRVATHAVGDSALDLTLAAYAAASADAPIKGRRWVVEHAFIARPEHLHRMKELGLVVSAQNHLWLAGPALVRYWGADRAALTTPMRAFLDSGLVVGSGTDAPVVPYPPLKTLYHFVTRRTISGGVLGERQAISRAEALRAATMGNAYLTFEEREKGSIEPGKVADFVVLSDDLLRCSDDALGRLAAVMTIVNGRVVYDAAAGPAR